MGGYKDLCLGKQVLKRWQHPSLPGGMQMTFDFVEKKDRFGRHRIAFSLRPDIHHDAGMNEPANDRAQTVGKQIKWKDGVSPAHSKRHLRVSAHLEREVGFR